ncbi:ATP-binding cassette domain-containing protein [Aestuariimicrobium kwangyangense]|uniref:ATP-binding cassette domain-containing protein n=1 Tax=Aestuariimicrobium kwangyangense TaxID=396389 RepID=UPI000423CB6D|nr:ABC transporter ATP-binding protein [Aestuariimicrobium kwangyangense]
MTALFTASDLVVRFGRTTALDGVTLAISAGDRLGIVGESGSGKTTLVRCLLGLQTPTAGALTRTPDAQLVFQDPRSSLDPRMRVRDIVAEPLTSRRLRSQYPRAVRRARAAEVLTQVGLRPDEGDRYPHEFSGGQRQRIAIARALAPRPTVLFADEPVSALDVSVRAQVLNLLTDLVDTEQLTLVLVSHDLAVVRHLCERVVVMRTGRIVEQGPTEQVYGHPREDYTRELLAAVPTLGSLDGRGPADGLRR